MKRIIILAVCLVLLSAGCIEEEDSGSDSAKKSAAASPAGADSSDGIKVSITSPGAGQIIQGNEDVRFDGSAEGGEGDLSYEWSSSIDGKLSTSKSFKQNPEDLEKGGHIIILKGTDESGRTGQGSVQIEVM